MSAELDAQAQAVIDQHLTAIMDRLEEIGVKPFGVVAGVLYGGRTSVNWCVSDDVHDEAGKLLTAEEIARTIVVDREAASRPGASPSIDHPMDAGTCDEHK